MLRYPRNLIIYEWRARQAQRRRQRMWTAVAVSAGVVGMAWFVVALWGVGR